MTEFENEKNDCISNFNPVRTTSVVILEEPSGLVALKSQVSFRMTKME